MHSMEEGTRMSDEERGKRKRKRGKGKKKEI